MAHIDLELDLAALCLNTDGEHWALMDLLEENGLLDSRYLYRGTDVSEIDGLQRKGPHKVGDQLCFFTMDEMNMIARGEIPTGQKGDAISYGIIPCATEKSDPVIAIYHASHFLNLDGEGKSALSDYEYRFRDPGKKYESLATVVRLKV